MPGNIILKPIQVQLDKSQDTQNPYLWGSLGDSTVKSHRAKFVDGQFVFADNKKLEIRTSFEPKMHLFLKDGDKKEPNDEIGNITLDLDVFETKEQSSEWYDIYSKNKIIGKILLEGCYQRDKGQGTQGMIGSVDKPGYVQSHDFKYVNHSTTH